MATWDEHNSNATPNERPEFEWAREGNRFALAEFFRRGGSVNAKNHKGYSLLMLAAYNDHWSTCNWLVEKGADVNSIDISGNSVLMGTCFKGHVRIVKLLLNAGADPFLQNCYGMTALDLAKAFHRQDVVKVLTEDPFHGESRSATVVKLISRRFSKSSTLQNMGRSPDDSLN